MKLKVIGTGSKGNGYVLKADNGDVLLIECGMPFRSVQNYLDFKLEGVQGCLVSHSHGDHAKYVDQFTEKGIKIYMSASTISELGVAGHNIKELTPLKTITVGRFKIMGFPVKHDVECLGFLIYHSECGYTLFLTDTFYCPYQFPGLNNIIIEANYAQDIMDEKLKHGGNLFVRNRVLKSHFSLENCKDFLMHNNLSAVNNIVLIHLSDTNSDEKRFRDEVHDQTHKNVVATFNGLEMELNKDPF